MIKVVVEEYCENCPYFNPQADSYIVPGDHYVHCREQDLCKHLMTYLEKVKEKV